MTQDSSATESELKFTLSDESAQALCQYLDQHMQRQPTLHLSNTYFDTATGDLNQHRIGCRIRRWLDENGQSHAEQTVKLAGHVKNGLHQRPEFNLPQGKQLTPDLTSFPTHIWPEPCDINQINGALKEQFKVEFERSRWLGRWQSGDTDCLIEIVFDQGFIESNGKQEVIHEIEMELVKGPVAGLLDCGKTLAERFNLLHFDKSKAERGYKLAKQAELS